MGNQLHRDKIESVVLTLDPDNVGTISGKSILYWILDEQYIRYKYILCTLSFFLAFFDVDSHLLSIFCMFLEINTFRVTPSV